MYAGSVVTCTMCTVCWGSVFGSGTCVISSLTNISLRKRDLVALLTVFLFLYVRVHSEKSVTIRESNHASSVYKEHYAQYYVPRSSFC